VQVVIVEVHTPILSAAIKQDDWMNTSATGQSTSFSTKPLSKKTK
jgi:hypothetical protein